MCNIIYDTNPMLELRNISKQYGNVTILDHTNLLISQGTSTAIIGASGTGKTTLLNIASLLDIPTSGEVYYFGEKICQEHYTQNRKKFISFVYQQHNLMPEFTVLENISIIAKMKGVYSEELTLHLLEKIGIIEHKNKKPSELSGGQKQRASIVRAIACKPQILFADEPTGNLDPQSAEVSSNLLISLAQEQNIAVFLITHNMEIAKKCNRILQIHEHQLTEVNNEQQPRTARRS
jgi:lipoprotein-releasing system ATP-binding protein